MQIKEFIKDNYEEYTQDIQSWVDNKYDTKFRNAFNKIREIYSHMQSQSRPITDSELEWVLTDLPLVLFSISEDLNKFRLDLEVIKLRRKSIKLELDKKVLELISNKEIDKSISKSWIESELSEHDIIIAAYESLIKKVETEISFSRELIMGCKKIWDARRKLEIVNPVGEVTSTNTNYSDRRPDRYREPYIR